jgi:hypothetical protein
MSEALIDRLYFIASSPELSKASADDIRRAALWIAAKMEQRRPTLLRAVSHNQPMFIDYTDELPRFADTA